MYYFKSIMQWVLTVVVGSLIAGYIESEFFNTYIKSTGQFFESVFFIGVMSMIVSSILSIPAVVILVFIRHQNKKNDLNYIQSRNRILITHAILSVLTFSIMYFLDNTGDGPVDSLIVIFSIVYPLTGHIIWYIGERTETQRIEPSLIR